MPFTSSTELLDWLSQNLLLNTDQVQQLRTWIGQNPGQGGAAELHAFCKEMLRRDWLTPFQINTILKDHADTLVLGANRLYSRLGEGAMGQVYKAWNVRLGRMVAVKMLHPDHTLSPKAMDRFRREMQTAAALDNPNIVLIRDADEANHVPYLVMDFFDGVDLAKKTRQEGPQPLTQAVDWIRQAALGLQHAFERGVVHRDIKPSNLLLVKTADGRAIVKILDFGLAKFERESTDQQPLTQAGRLIGTVDFIAPEQAIDAHNADVRADIYSLGCTLFYLLTGKPPFAGKDHLEKLSVRLQGDPPHIADIRRDVPAGLDAIIFKMMAREPGDRYQLPQEAAAALAPFTGQTPLAMPVGARAPLAAPVIEAVPSRTAAAVVEVDENPFGEPAFGAYEGAADETEFHAEPAASPSRRRHAEELDDEPAPSRKPLLFGIIGLVTLLAAIGVALFFFWPRSTVVEPALGTMTLRLDSPPGREWGWKEQNRKRSIIVKVVRRDFSGPVNVSVDNCPEWLQAAPFTIPPAKNEGEFKAMVKSDAPAGPFTMKIVATAANAQPASVDYEMEIVPLVLPKIKDPPRPMPDEKKDESNPR